jgi:multicomponent Na+:H+ antiporter subunit G
MRELISGILMVLGALFMFLAAVGILRMPDVFMRLSASTKAATLGVGFILVSVAVYFDDLGVTSRALASVFFVLLTVPVAAHMIGRIAYFVGDALWEGTVVDELRGHYEALRDELGSPPREPIRPDEPDQ